MTSTVSDDELRSRVRDLMPRAKSDLTEMVAFKSVHDAAQFPPAECDAMVDWLIETLTEAGVADVTAHVTSDGSKAVTGHIDGPAGSPTVLLYFHHDVQPPLGEDEWISPVWELTERDGRWYGRGAADCKGNIAVHLTALRAVADHLGVGVKIIGEGSEEQGTGGIESFVEEHPEYLEADAIIILDTGNFAVGKPTLTTSLRGIANVIVTVETLESALHSGVYGGAAPDALAALIAMLASMRDADGNTTIDGLPDVAPWTGVEYPDDEFRADAKVLDGVGLLGSGSVSARIWARPAVTVLGMDCPPVVGSSASIPPRARARINLRVPPGMKSAVALDALTAHLTSHAPWGARVTVEPEAAGSPFQGSTSGPAHDSLVAALEAAYGVPAGKQGQGGSIPLCNVLAETFPDAEILLMGIEEPSCLIHAPNESVDPAEIERIALAEAIFLRDYGRAAGE